MSPDDFGELLIRRVRDPLVEAAIADAGVVGDDGAAAIRAIDAQLAEVLAMFDDPRWQDERGIHSVPARIILRDVDNEEGDAPFAGIDLAANSDGLVGDYVDWVERFSQFPAMPWLDSGRTFPSDDLAFRRAVREEMRRLLAGELPGVKLPDAENLVLPPGGLLYPELAEAATSDGRASWIGEVRLYQRVGDQRTPTDQVAFLEVTELDDGAVTARVINVLRHPKRP